MKADLQASNVQLWLTKPYWVEQLLAQFHMVCVLFSNICTLLHSKIHTATAWVTTLSFRWIKLFFLPFLSVFFTQVSETISFWLRSRQPTGNCTSWGAKEKKKKKSFRTLSLLLHRHGAQHAGKESNCFILASDTLFFVQSCPNLSDLG